MQARPFFTVFPVKINAALDLATVARRILELYLKEKEIAQRLAEAAQIVQCQILCRARTKKAEAE